jgi:hypothetical protein
VISNKTLRTELRQLASKANNLDKALGQGDDLPDNLLAESLIKAGKLNAELARLARRVEAASA